MRKTLFTVLIIMALMVGAMSTAHAATGSALVTQYGCLGCHNPIPTASTNAAMVTMLSNAINGGVMNGITSLKALTTADIQAIADYLVPAAAPGACSGYTYSVWSACVNGQKTRTVIGETPAGCTGTPPTAAVLTKACTPGTPAPPPTTTHGANLYMQRCSACHGSLERSQVRGARASEIRAAIVDVSNMTYLNFLTRAQIRAIARALVTTTPPPPPPAPDGGVHPAGWLEQHSYFADRNGTSSCTACHGQNLQGGIGPSCYSCHSNND